MSALVRFAAVVVMGLVGACSSPEPPPAPPSKPPVDTLGVKPVAPASVPVKPPETPPVAKDPATEARTLYNARCVVCHGASGKGDGAVAMAMTPKPRDYTDPGWQKSITDELIAKTILKGGAAVGKSPLMPANADLEKRPEVVDALVAIVRGFAKK